MWNIFLSCRPSRRAQSLTRPSIKLGLLIVDLVVGIGLGFIPGVDNFVHLGGFLLGLICAAIFYPVISTTKRHKQIMWAVRIAMLPLAIVLYVVLIRNFYSANPFEGALDGMHRHFGLAKRQLIEILRDSLQLVSLPVMYPHFIKQSVPRVRRAAKFYPIPNTDSLIFRTGITTTTAAA